MSASIEPAPQDLRLRIMTQAGWVNGVVTQLRGRRLIELLDREQDLLPLTDVKLEGKVDRLSSLMLRRSSILVVLPADPELAGGESLLWSTEHRIDCLLAHGFVSGSLRVMKGVAIHEYLARDANAFVALHDAHVRLRDPWSNERVDLLEPLVFLNRRAIVGVSERTETSRF